MCFVLKQRKGVILVEPGKIVICEWNSDKISQRGGGVHCVWRSQTDSHQVDCSWGLELWQVSIGWHCIRCYSIYYTYAIKGTPRCVMSGALECLPGRSSQKGARPTREWQTQEQENWLTPVTECLHQTAHRMKFINWCSGDHQLKSKLIWTE